MDQSRSQIHYSNLHNSNVAKLAIIINIVKLCGHSLWNWIIRLIFPHCCISDSYSHLPIIFYSFSRVPSIVSFLSKVSFSQWHLIGSYFHVWSIAPSTTNWLGDLILIVNPSSSFLSSKENLQLVELFLPGIVCIQLHIIWVMRTWWYLFNGGCYNNNNMQMS